MPSLNQLKRGCRVLIINRIIERGLNIILILSMLLSSLSLPIQSVSAAKIPNENPKDLIPHNSYDVPAIVEKNSNPVLAKDESIPGKRPIVDRPEPRKGTRPQATLSVFQEVIPQTKNQNLVEPENTGPKQPLPLMFIENVGQFDTKTKFQIKGLQDTVNFTQNEFWVTSLLPETIEASKNLELSATSTPGKDKQDEKNAAKSTKGVNLKFEFVGAETETKVEGIDKLNTSVSFFEGKDPQKWRSNVPVWSGVRYVDIYPGVDLEVKSEGGLWSWQLIVKDEDRLAASKSKNKNGIVLRVHGAKSVNLDENNLLINSETGNTLLPILRLNRPNQQKSSNGLLASSNPKLMNNDLIIDPPEIISTQEITATATATATVISQATSTATTKPQTTPKPTFTSTPAPVLTEIASPTVTTTPQPTNTPPAPTTSPLPSYTISPATITPLPTLTTPVSSTTPLSTSVTPTVLEKTSTVASTPTTIVTNTPPSKNPDITEVLQATQNSTIALSSRYVGQNFFVNYHPVTENKLKSPKSIANQTELASGTADLTYSTYLQGGAGTSIAVDSLGAMYITGQAFSGNFPVTPGAFQEFSQGDNELFIQKLNQTGDQSIFATYIGGSAQEQVNDIIVDNKGNSYITGVTASMNFPTTPGAYNTTSKGNGEVFVTKLNPSGTSLDYSTYLGGSNGETGFALAVNPTGEVYIVGQTFSSDYPTTEGAYNRNINSVGNYDGFVTKLNSLGSRLVYSTYFGGSTADCEIGQSYNECTIAIDSAGAAYITGPTFSSNFPTTVGAYNRTFSGIQAAFVMKVKPDGSGLIYSTFLGGSNSNCETTCAIAVDLAGSAYITGVTNAADFPHSTYGTYSGGRDTFLVKVNPDGSNLDYSMLIGGTGDDIARDIAVDEYGFAYVTGETNSIDFPTSTNAYQRILGGTKDSFILKASPDGTGFTYSSLIGGTSEDWGMGNALGRDRQIYITGSTGSNDFPVTQGAYRTSGSSVGFISKFNLGQYRKVQDLSSLCIVCSNDTQGSAGDPILTRTGAFSESFEYLPFSTRAGNLSFTTWYSSSALAIDRYSTLMGYGWTNNHEIRLIFSTDPGGEAGYVLFKSNTGNQYYFVDHGDGTYTADAGVTGDLAKHNGPPITYTITDTSQNVYAFDATGKITSWTNALGFYWTYAYDVSNRLHRVTDDTGLRFLEFGYDTQNRIHTVADHTGRSITLGYDANGDLVSLVDPLTQPWAYSYDNAHHLRLVTNPANVVVIHTEYDASGRAFQQYDSQGQLILSIVYNSDGTTQITNSSDGIKTHTYGGRNTLNAGSLEDGTVSEPQKMYDDNFRPVAITDGNSKNTQLEWNPTEPNLTKVIDPEKGKTDLTYNLLNSLTSVIDANDHLTTFTYDINDPDPKRHTLLTQSEDALSNITQYEYTTSADAPQPSGLLKRIIAPQNQITSFTYDQFGQRLTITDPQNRTTSTAYDALGRAKSVQDPFGQVNWTCYDAIGRVIRSVANATGDGTTPQTDPCDTQNYQSSGDPLFDRISQTFYDLNGNVIGTVDPKGIVTRTFFDNKNRPHLVTRNLKDPQNLNATPAVLMQLTAPPAYDPADPDRNVSTETRYDNEGNPIATIDPAGVITRTYYDAFNRPIFVTRNLKDSAHPNATIEALLEMYAPPAFDANYPDRNLTNETRYDTAGNVIAIIDPAGRLTRTYYDGNNRQRFIVQNLTNYDYKKNTPPAYNPAYPDQNVRTETQYDAAGNPIFSIDPLGTKTRSCFDALGRVERTVINPSGNGTTPATNPCDGVNYVPGSGSDVDRITDTIYDGNGKVVVTIDPVGIITRNYYDAVGRQIAVTQNLRNPGDPDASLSELLELSQPPAYDSGHPDWNITTQTIYDTTNGLTIATVNPKGVITRTYYDSLNRPYLVVQNLTGQTPQNSVPPAFDPAFPDRNVRTETVYDADGMTIASIANDGTINRTYYDNLGRVIVTVRNLTGQAVSVATPPSYNPAFPDQNVHTESLYDPTGKVIKTLDPVGKVTFVCFDGLGRELKTVTNPSVVNPCGSYTPSTDTELDITTQTLYDGSGNRRAAIDAAGKTTYFLYDSLNRLTQQTDPLNHQIKYSYDAAGNQISKTDGKNVVTKYEYTALSELKAVIENYKAPGGTTNEQNVRTEYTYDKLGNRKTIKNALTHVTTFNMDGLGRLISEQDAMSHTTTYGYDAAGNRTSVLDANGATTNFIFDGLNRLILIDYPAPDTDVTFTYDAAGNRKTMGDGSGTTQWTYDKLNRATDISQPVVGNVHYAYNAVGNQTSLTYPDTRVVNYNYDTAGRLHLVTSWDSLITTYNYDRANRLQNRTLPNTVTSNYSYDDANHLQSLTHTLGGQTLASYQYTYDANGNRVVADDSVSQSGGNPPNDIVFEDGFESGNTSAWSFTYNNNNLNVNGAAAIINAYGMAVSAIGSDVSYVNFQNPTAAVNYFARFYFDPNSINMPSGGIHSIYMVMDNSLVVESIELQFNAGDYQLRSKWFDDAGNGIYSPWVSITDGPHAVEVDWRAASAAGMNNGSLTFFIDDVVQSANNSIDNDTKRARSIKLGLATTSYYSSQTSNTEYFDGFEARSSSHIGLDSNALPAPSHSTQDPIFADSFESNDFTAWSQSVTGGGDLSVSVPAGIVGGRGLQTAINDSTLMYITDWTPYEETRYRTRFYFDPNSISMADGDNFDLFHANGRDGTILSSIEFRFSAGDYQMRGANRDDSGVWNRTVWMTITDSPHAIELDWQSASVSGANNGKYTLWIDDVQQANLMGMDNDTLKLNLVQLGVLTAPVATTAGTVYFDAFVSRRSTYIGVETGALPPVLPPTLTNSIFSDDFETGNLANWSKSYNATNNLLVSSDAKVIGNYGLKVLMGYWNSSPKYVVDWLPFQDTHYRARFYFDPNTIPMSPNSPIRIFYAYGRDIPVVRIALQRIYENNNYIYQIRSEAADDLGDWVNTPWTTITDDFHAIEIMWNAASGSGNNNGLLNLWVDGSFRTGINNVDNDTLEIDSIKLGAIDGLIDPEGSIYFDQFVSRRNTYIGPDPSLPSDIIFADAFETGDLTIWSSSVTDGGDLNVGYSRPILGSSYEMQATIDDNQPIYVVDQAPTAEPHYRARFYFDPNSISMAEGDTFDLFQGQDAGANPIIRYELRYQSGIYQLRLQAVSDTGIWISSPWTNLSDSPHAVEFDWQAASAIGANDGSLTFWLDGNKLNQKADLDNDTVRIETVLLGAVAGIDNGTRGMFFMDGFESHRTGAIGLDPSAHPYTRLNPVFSDGFETGDFSAWSNILTNNGHLSLNAQAAIVGSSGLQAVIDNNNPLYLEDWTPHSDRNYNARFYFDPNYFTISNTDVLTIFNLRDPSGTILARIKLRMFNGEYQVMAEVINDASNWTGTSWIRISNQRHAIELDWLAASAPNVNNGTLTFIIDNLPGSTINITGLDNDLRLAEDIQWGVISGIGDGTRGTIFFDAFVSQRTNVIGLDPNVNPVPARPDALFADGFETGDLSAWSRSQTDDGHLSVTSAAAITGNYGLQANLNGNHTMYVTDWTPADENHYRARFYFDPNSFATSTDYFEIFHLYNYQDVFIAAICVLYESGDYHIKSWVSDPDRGGQASDWIRITDAPHAIELDWRSAVTEGSANGGLTFWVDNIQRFSVSNINNYGAMVSYANLGVTRAPDVGNPGTIYLDGFESRRDTYIGLGAGFQPPDLFSDGFESGSLSAWSNLLHDGNSLSVTSLAAIAGSKGLEVTVDDNNDAFVIDNKLNNESRYRVRFYFNPNGISMNYLDDLRIFTAGDCASIELRFSGGDYQVRLWVMNNSYSQIPSNWITISDYPHAFELDWKTATSYYSNDGYATLWIDGDQKANLTTNNYYLRVNSAYLGAFSGIDSGTRGSLFFDAFETHLSEPIGLDPLVPLPPAPPVKGDPIFADGFESGKLSAWSRSDTNGGQLSVTTQAAIIGNKGMQAVISDTNPAFVTDWNPWDETHYRARFYFDPNSYTNTSGMAVEIFRLYSREGNCVAAIRSLYQSGNYMVNAWFSDPTQTSPESEWVSILDGPHALEIDWTPATATGMPNGTATFWVDGVQRFTVSNIVNYGFLADYATLGMNSYPDSQFNGTLYFDGFESRRNTYIGLDPAAPAVKLFSDGFESGNLSAWSGNVPDGGSLTVTTGAAIVGTKGLQTSITTNNDKYVYDNRLSNEPRYRARFYFDPNSLIMADLDSFTLFSVVSQATIDLRSAAGDFQVRSSIVNDASSTTYSPWVTITDGPHALEVDWKASSAVGANDGYLTFWVDGVQQGSLTAVDNDTRRATSARMGVFGGVDTGTRGSVYFDAFESRYTEYIGLDPTALTPPAPPTKTDALFADTFESGDLSHWGKITTASGDLSVSSQAAVTGAYGLKVLQDDTSADYVTDYQPWDETQYRARFYLKTNSMLLAETTPLYIFRALNREGVVVARIALQNNSGDYQLKAEALNDAGVFTTASTTWTRLWEGLHAVEINWQAATAVGANNGVLTLWIDDTQQATFTAIDNDQHRIDQVQLGAISGMSASSNGSLYMDLFEARRNTYIGLDGSAPAPQTTAPDLIYANGLESGNFNGWSSTNLDSGHLSVTTGAKLAGNYGLSTYINDNTSLYVTDKRPTSETQYRARFYFNPNSIAMADANAYYMFYGMQGSSSPAAILRLEVRKSLGDYQVRLSAVDDASAWSNTAWYTLANQLHYLELNWQAATVAGANNGVITLWIDGVQKESLATLDNDTRRIDQIQWGGVAGIDTGTRGTEYLDLFESHRSSYIGADPSAPTIPTPPTPTDAIFTDGFESNNLNAWSANAPDGGHLSVSTAAKLVGNYGLAAYINDNTAMSVTDWTPSEESHYRAQFRFHPNGITMATGNAHYIFYALSFDGLVVARVEFGKVASGYQIRAGAVTDASSTTFTDMTWTTGVTNISHKIEIEWQAATAPGANDGILTLWLDGTQVNTLTGLDNDTRRVNAGQMGPVAGIDTGTRGTEYFDAFISRRNTWIGMAKPSGVEVANLETPIRTSDSAILPVVYRPAWLFKPLAAPRLTELATTSPISYAYDPLGRLTYADYGGGMYFQYSYDAVGNRLSETTALGTTTYTYDAANRLATVNGVSYSWDNNGNLLNDGVSTYSYDHANRLTSVTTGGTTYTYAYNGLGDRVSQTVGGVTTRYTLDLNAGLTQVLADGTNTYLYGLERIAQYTGTTSSYFLGDALNSVRQLTDASGAVTLAKTYKPFGEVLNSTGSGASVFGFDGEQTDVTGLQYLRARYYLMSIGRFMTRDTWGGDSKLPMSYNSWAFVYGNPINFVDPSGHCINCENRVDEVLNFQRTYGVTIEGFLKGLWGCDPINPNNFNGDLLAGIIDGVKRIGDRFSAYFGGSGPSAFRLAFGYHNISFRQGTNHDIGMTYTGNIVELNPNFNKVNDIYNYHKDPSIQLLEGAYPFSRLVVHELGHVFDDNINVMSPSSKYLPTKWLARGIYEMNGRYSETGNFVTGNRDGKYDRSKEDSGFLGTDFFSSGKVITGYQWHSYYEPGGNNSDEDWADIFQNWVFESFSGKKFGTAINDWTNFYMPVWIRLANGMSLLPEGNDEH